jgi:hypothetical protein
MPRKSLASEQVIAKLRHIEVALSNGKALPQACKDAAISPQSHYGWRNLPHKPWTRKSVTSDAYAQALRSGRKDGAMCAIAQIDGDT